MNQNLIYPIAITLAKGIGLITARQLIDSLEDISVLFSEKKQVLLKDYGIPRKILEEIRKPEILERAEKEIEFIQKNQIIPLFIKEEDYPFRLKECADAPILLYKKGNADLNAERIISIVGTRNSTIYGKEITEKLIQNIQEVYPGTVIVSGLAYGIDICAHKAALKNGLNTIGVLAHGLDIVYPYLHRNTAKEMIENGGLLSDFISETNPDRQNFIKRNRIVAGIADCTIVIESASKGGALITASIAESYNRDVFAYPGKTTDPYSSGCNNLIKEQKAAMITCADDLFREMCWNKEKKKKSVQKNIFIDFSDDEQLIVDIIKQANKIQLNRLSIQSELSISKLSSLLFGLEMKGVIQCLPGGVYRII